MSPRLLYTRQRLVRILATNYLGEPGLARGKFMPARILAALTRFGAGKDIPR